MLYVAKRGLCLKILMQFPLLQSPRPYFSDNQWRKRTKIYIFSSMIAKEAEGSRLFLKFMRRIVGLRPDFQLPERPFRTRIQATDSLSEKCETACAHIYIYRYASERALPSVHETPSVPAPQAKGERHFAVATSSCAPHPIKTDVEQPSREDRSAKGRKALKSYP